MKKIYAIATKTREVYGHGEFGEELRITKGSYGFGEFPPCFEEKERAESYLAGLNLSSRVGKEVVELELRG